MFPPVTSNRLPGANTIAPALPPPASVREPPSPTEALPGMVREPRTVTRVPSETRSGSMEVIVSAPRSTVPWSKVTAAAEVSEPPAPSRVNPLACTVKR